jgi:hypothetical protein
MLHIFKMAFLVGLLFKCLSWLRACTFHETQKQRKSKTVTTETMMTSQQQHPSNTTVAMNLTFNTLVTGTFTISADIYEGGWKNEAVSLEVDVIRNIYTKKHLEVVHCKCSRHGDFCMKLRYPFSAHDKESSKYVEMLNVTGNDGGNVNNDGANIRATRYFPEVFAFIKVRLLNGELWGGICMKLMGQPIVDILYVDSIPKRKDQNVKNLAKLAAEFWKVPLVVHDSKSSSEDEEDKKRGGVRVKRMEKRGIQTSLTVACLELLHKLHMCGWVHGDSHLGNFVLDPATWRVYLIDMERSFASTDAVQHMLDIQECFGHACGLIVSYSSGQNWDMDDIWGVAAKLHPLLRSSSKKKRLLQDTSVMHMLPVCNCFAEEDEEDKLHGCICCRSKKNIQTANFFKMNGFAHIQNLFNMSLKMAKAYVFAARKKTIAEFNQMESLLLDSQCKRDLEKFILLSQQSRSFDVETPRHYLNVDEKINFDDWLRKILYLGSFFEYWRFKLDKLIIYLRFKGHNMAVSDLLTFTEKKRAYLQASV